MLAKTFPDGLKQKKKVDNNDEEELYANELEKKMRRIEKKDLV